MTHEDWKRHLLAGNTIRNIGQLPDQTIRWLRRETRAGRVEQFTTYDFPMVKRSYRLAAPAGPRPEC